MTLADTLPFILVFAYGVLAGFAPIKTELKIVSVAMLTIIYGLFLVTLGGALNHATGIMDPKVVIFLGKLVTFLMLGAIGVGLIDRKAFT